MSRHVKIELRIAGFRCRDAALENRARRAIQQLLVPGVNLVGGAPYVLASSATVRSPSIAASAHLRVERRPDFLSSTANGIASKPAPAHKIDLYYSAGSDRAGQSVCCADVTYIPIGSGLPLPDGDRGLGKPCRAVRPWNAPEQLRNPEITERRKAREAIVAARNARIAERKAAERARKEREAAELVAAQAAEAAAREAALQAEREAQAARAAEKAEREADERAKRYAGLTAVEVERKAALAARRATRKAKKRKR